MNNSDGNFRFLGVSDGGCVGVDLDGECVVPGSTESLAVVFFGIFHVVDSFPGAGPGVLVSGVAVVALEVFFVGCWSKGAVLGFRFREVRGFC